MFEKEKKKNTFYHGVWMKKVHIFCFKKIQMPPNSRDQQLMYRDISRKIVVFLIYLLLVDK